MVIHGNYFDCFSDCLIVWLLDCLSDLTAPATQELPLYRVRAEGACSLCRAKTTSRSNTIKHSSNHSRVVIYSLVIRSFSTLFPFQKGKNEGNTLEIDRIKNDATVEGENWKLANFLAGGGAGGCGGLQQKDALRGENRAVCPVGHRAGAGGRGGGEVVGRSCGEASAGGFLPVFAPKFQLQVQH